MAIRAGSGKLDPPDLHHSMRFCVSVNMLAAVLIVFCSRCVDWVLSHGNAGLGWQERSLRYSRRLSGYLSKLRVRWPISRSSRRSCGCEPVFFAMQESILGPGWRFLGHRLDGEQSEPFRSYGGSVTHALMGRVGLIITDSELPFFKPVASNFKSKYFGL